MGSTQAGGLSFEKGGGGGGGRPVRDKRGAQNPSKGAGITGERRRGGFISFIAGWTSKRPLFEGE